MVLKPSEVAPATSALLAELIPLYLDTSVIRVVQGGVAETTALLEQKWDKIFYTGASLFNFLGRVIPTPEMYTCGTCSLHGTCIGSLLSGTDSVVPDFSLHVLN